jgi:hypothetical protein
VRYDHNNGDKTELSGGHGTKVACVAAGNSNDFDGVKANGIAEGAKLHIYDISHVNSGMDNSHTVYSISTSCELQ